MADKQYAVDRTRRTLFIPNNFDSAVRRIAADGRNYELWMHRWGIDCELMAADLSGPLDRRGQPMYWYPAREAPAEVQLSGVAG